MRLSNCGYSLLFFGGGTLGFYKAVPFKGLGFGVFLGVHGTLYFKSSYRGLCGL